MKTFGRWPSDAVLRYLGEVRVADLSQVNLRTMRECSLLEGYPLQEPAPSGPQLGTCAEVERVVAEAVDVRMHGLTDQIGVLALAETRKCMSALSTDVSAPPHTWQIKCGGDSRGRSDFAWQSP